MALQLIIAGLAITPLRRFTGVNLIKFRRAIGLLAFFYIVAASSGLAGAGHGDAVAQIWPDIVKRPYMTIGMAGFVLLMPACGHLEQRVGPAAGATGLEAAALADLSGGGGGGRALPVAGEGLAGGAASSIWRDSGASGAAARFRRRRKLAA